MCLNMDLMRLRWSELSKSVRVVVVVAVSNIQQKLLYTVANPARGLLNREKKQEKSRSMCMSA